MARILLAEDDASLRGFLTRALERAGFEREGVLRSAQFLDGAWRDVVVFSRLRD